ncbi:MULTISPECIES: ATP-binding protein [Cyanophyceae]|uniref:ATP-binding protein n=1 Tax=Cyanophyceae TaxID=3028117 RepID=UPI001688E030|nr:MULTISPECIES: ATP-binding protein [Cyanophyceae]MBD1916005.1 PAS domain-containing protein [Phormidium sp. FACHB-77]MBD2031726.1 PAS domain-containing protein [Phormidium sp. FACHB-322]MBD2052647.1 PAS domain-containing protein [Leptolyngbya sp. FACHB-60]
MRIAPLPDNEVERLKILHSLSILDTAPEEIFDDLARLASQICNTPIALVSLVDADRQWFKSSVGLSVPETSRDIAFCSHAILQPDLFLVPDASTDQRFSDNPLVTSEPHIRFYAGAPLITSEGAAIGTLCVLDQEPRKLSAEQSESLKIISRQVAKQIEQRRDLASLAQISLDIHQVGEKLRLTQERFELAILGSSGGIWDWNMKTKEVFFSPRWKSILGYEDHEIPNHLEEWIQRLHPEDLQRAQNALAAYLKRKIPTYDLEYRLRHKDGTYRWILSRSVALWDDQGKPYRMAGSHIDITDRRQAEEIVEKSLQKERELSELKTRFISMASHEFRTPLTSIVLYAELLKNYSHIWDKKEKDDAFQRIYDAVQTMTELMDGVLAVGHIEEGKQAFNPALLNFPHLIQDVIEQIKLISQTQCNIFLDASPERLNVILDERIIRQVLTNLVFNAVKYSPSEGDIKISCRYQEGTLALQIQDQGIGIPDENQENIFEPFYRAKNVDCIAGTGLGLAIVKQGVHAHRGTIAVESEIGKGTTFTIALPCDTANSQQP